MPVRVPLPEVTVPLSVPAGGVTVPLSVLLPLPEEPPESVPVMVDCADTGDARAKSNSPEMSSFVFMSLNVLAGNADSFISIG